MSQAEVQATAPQANWVTEELAPDSHMLSGGPPLMVGGSRFAGALIFAEGALRYVVLRGESASSCSTLIPVLVEELEATFGAFSSAPGPVEYGPADGVSMTAGGSEIRSVEPSGRTAFVYSSYRGAMTIQVSGETRGESCSVRLTFSAPAPVAQSAALGYAELDRARTLANPAWVRRPTDRTFARAYPETALLRHLSGTARIDCIVNANGSLRCVVAQEDPIGAGFGAAALVIARDFVVREGEAGDSAVGKRLRLEIGFHVD